MIRKPTRGGTIYRKGRTWYLRCNDQGHQRRSEAPERLVRQLGSIDDMTKTKAREIADDFLESINGVTLAPETAVTAADFVDAVYLPRLKQDVRPSTYRGYKVVWNAIKPFCADLWTRHMRTKHVKAILDAMGKTGPFNTRSLQAIEVFMFGAFVLAIEDDYYVGANPVTEARLPNKEILGASTTHAYSLEGSLDDGRAARASANIDRCGCIHGTETRRVARVPMGRLPQWANSCFAVDLKRTRDRSQDGRVQESCTSHPEASFDSRGTSQTSKKSDLGMDFPERRRQGR